jgi:hypothetical protein
VNNLLFLLAGAAWEASSSLSRWSSNGRFSNSSAGVCGMVGRFHI